ncbi:MAG TPA: TonB family protein [Steroidobacteraceae bacterium]|nr:TonB family protein [Steroidobacteraceae bacterium]
MPKSLRKHELTAPEPPDQAVIQSVKKKSKLAVLLVTGDDALWPQIGASLSADLILKQLDSIDELVASTPSGQPAIVLWDARNHADPANVLSRLHLHSPRFAIVALDDASSADAWHVPIQHRQVVTHLALPIAADGLAQALAGAHEEVNSRLALLGDETAPAATSGGAGSAKRPPWLGPAIIAGVLIVAAAAFMLARNGAPATQPAAAPPIAANNTVTTTAAAPSAVKSRAEVDAKVDALIEKAQRAMLDRHFIDPVAGSALSLYREVLILEPDNGEALQGLQRLSEILIARVQSALDDRKFDLALQFLESARSIDANDSRLSALDEKISSMRAELGPAQIMAAVNAQNFDRATQLIDEAARAKFLPSAKLAQLREEVHRRRDEFDAGRLLKLVEARVQQDHLIDPRNDSAVYYLEQAKQAGADAADYQAAKEDLLKRLSQVVRTAIEQRRFSDVDRVLAEMRAVGAPPATVTGLQRELSVARPQPAAQKPDQPQFLELAQARLAQGKLTEPDNDSALYFLNQLRTADPKNSAIAELKGAVQSQILDRANAALGANDMEKAEALAQMAAEIGSSPDLDAFNGKLRQRFAMSDLPQVAEKSLTRANKLDVQYPTRAMQDNVEGWVELGYTVAANGSVTNVKIINSQPANIFDAAATRAVGHLRYKPPLKDGKPISVGTMVRIVFVVPK